MTDTQPTPPYEVATYLAHHAILRCWQQNLSKGWKRTATRRRLAEEHLPKLVAVDALKDSEATSQLWTQARKQLDSAPNQHSPAQKGNMQ